MKVVDMFSAQLPCLAIGGYPSIKELVKDDGSREDFLTNSTINGLIFKDSSELSIQLKLMLTGFDPVTGSEALRAMRRNLSKFTEKANSWDSQWRQIMAVKVFGQVIQARVK